MKTIQRSRTPTCLAQQPENQDWGAFMGSRCHTNVGMILRREQQGLCSYCEIEISDSDGHIEHMEPRSRNQTRTYDYTNLVLSCDGGTVEHCGHYKDDRRHNPNHAWDSTRFAPPHDPATVTLFQYVIDGSITPTSVDPAKSHYLIGYLGLDCARLTERRKQHARDLIDTLGDRPEPDLVDWLRQDHLQPDATDRLKQFHSLSKMLLEV